ncbi:MAG: arginine--tRNA ligase [Planctomycetota bacterium]
MDSFSGEIASIISGLAGIAPVDAQELFRIPPKPEMGDLSFPCFTLAKNEGRKPNEIAAELAGKIQPSGLIERVEASGPYVNFYRNRVEFTRRIIDECRRKAEKYGAGGSGADKNVVVDYSSPNIAKPFHVGHLRSTIIGAALKRLFESQGYSVIGINHLGDWGTQFGAMISAYKHWGSEDTFSGSEDEIIEKCFQLYVRFHAEEEKNPELTSEKQEYFRRLENGDEEMSELWKRFREVSLAEFRRIYDRLNVNFESWDGEAAYNDKLEAAIEEAQNADVLTDGERGAKIVDLEEDGINVPAMVRKADGATTYITRDIAAALERWEKYRFAKCLYIVGQPQTFHFRQLFAVLKKMGREWAGRCVHIPFGHVLGMKTRAGKVLFLDEILNESVSKARKIIEEKNPELENREAVAEAVGIGAIVVADLSRQRIKDYTFKWEEVLSFDGDTGPYLQYALVRSYGILRTFAEKYGEEIPSDFDPSLMMESEEQKLINMLASYPETLNRALEACEPAVITQFLFKFAAAFHVFHVKHRVVGDDKDLTAARINLVNAVRQVLENGFHIIGLKPLERM